MRLKGTTPAEAFTIGSTLVTVRTDDHPGPDVVAEGVWIASEVAGRTDPVLVQAAALVAHPSARARFFALDVVLLDVLDDSRLLADALLLIEDRDATVRWKAMRFASLASQGQLSQGASWLDGPHRRLVADSGILGTDPLTSRARIDMSLRGPAPTMRRWAAAAAARLADQELLRQAKASSDPEVADFVEELRSLHRKLEASS